MAQDITELFRDKPDCNIAVITGSVSNIIAFDIDGEEAGDYFEDITKGIDDIEIRTAIRATMKTKTGSGIGKHILLAFNVQEFQNEKIKTRTLWISKNQHTEIKLKVEGGYIVVPPSLSKTGQKYEFIDSTKPVTLSRERIYKLVAAFNNSMDSSNVSNVSNRDDNSFNTNEEGVIYKNLSDEKIEALASKLRSDYIHGQRDEIIFGLSGLLLKKAVSLISAKKLVSALCDYAKDEEKNKRIEV